MCLVKLRLRNVRIFQEIKKDKNALMYLDRWRNKIADKCQDKRKRRNVDRWHAECLNIFLFLINFFLVGCRLPVQWRSRAAVKFHARLRARNARRYPGRWPGRSVSMSQDKSVKIFLNKLRNSSAQKFQGLSNLLKLDKTKFNYYRENCYQVPREQCDPVTRQECEQVAKEECK